MNNNTKLKENVMHGTFQLPLEFYHCSIPDEFTVLPPHWHEELEFTLITEGCCIYQIGLNSIQVSAGDLIILSASVLHGVRALSGRTMSSETFVFNMNMLGLSYPDACASKYLLPILNGRLDPSAIFSPASDGYEQIKQVFTRLKDCYQNKPPYFELDLKSELFHFMGLLFRFCPVMTQSPKQDTSEIMEKIRMVLVYVHENCKRQISVEELAGLCHYTPAHFMRFFKLHIHMTCIEYINHYRLTIALEALENTTQPITNIALDCGFNNISYFNRQFKKRFGLTPREYRRQCSVRYEDGPLSPHNQSSFPAHPLI